MNFHILFPLGDHLNDLCIIAFYRWPFVFVNWNSTNVFLLAVICFTQDSFTNLNLFWITTSARLGHLTDDQPCRSWCLRLEGGRRQNNRKRPIA
jgi:hypothetical protein